MLIFNLTDETPPFKPARRPRDLKVSNVLIKPGESEEVPDRVPTSDFSGLIVANKVSVGMPPEWYRLAKAAAARGKPLPSRAKQDEESAAREPVDMEKPATARKQKSKKSRKKRG